MQILRVALVLSVLSACAAAPIAGPDLSGLKAFPRQLTMARSSFKKASAKLRVRVNNRGRTWHKAGELDVVLTAKDGVIPPISARLDLEGAELEPSSALERQLAVSWLWPEDAAVYQTLIDAGSVVFVVSGSLGVSGESIPVTGEVRAPTPVLPKLHIPHVEATREGNLSSADLTFQFHIKNDNFFPFKIKKLVGDVEVAGVVIGEDVIVSTGEKIPTASSSIFEVPIEMTRATHPKRLRGLLREGIIPYKFTGEIIYYGVTRPVELVGEFTFPEF